MCTGLIQEEAFVVFGRITRDYACQFVLPIFSDLVNSIA